MSANNYLRKDFSSFRGKGARNSDSLVTFSVSVVFMLIGLLLIFYSFSLGLIMFGFGILMFILQSKRVSLFRRLSKLNEELLSTFSDKEIVKNIFSPLGSNNSKIHSASAMSEDNLIENTMILTNKRIIFVYVSALDLSKSVLKEIWNSIRDKNTLDEFKIRIHKKIKEDGLLKLIRNSKIAYSFNYSEISKIEIKEKSKKIIFFYRDNKYSYFVRKEDVEELKETFKDYINS